MVRRLVVPLPLPPLREAIVSVREDLLLLQLHQEEVTLLSRLLPPTADVSVAGPLLLLPLRLLVTAGVGTTTDTATDA